jgi:hypothetical protein
MYSDPTVIQFPVMGGMVQITIAGSCVTVKGAHRVVAEMPITRKYGGKPRFACDSMDAPHDGVFVVDTALSADNLDVVVGMQKGDPRETGIYSPTILVSPVQAVEGEGWTLVTKARRAVSEHGHRIGQDQFVLQEIPFEQQVPQKTL